MMKKYRNNSGNAAVVALVIVVIAAFVGFYYWKTRMAAQQAEAEQLAAVKPAVAPRAMDTAPHYPVAAPAAAPSGSDFKSIGSTAQSGGAESQGTTALPQLDESDHSIEGALSAQFAQTKLAKLINMDGLIRRFVIAVDNSLRSHAPPAESALFIPAPGKFLTSGKGDHLVVDPANSARYKAYMDMVAEADPIKLVSAYKRFYPLFQAAYKDIDASGYFNDRLVEALDSMIATPNENDPIRLVAGPTSYYKYAEPQFEERPSGQKLILRIGPENAAIVKAKLKQIRDLLANASQ